MTKEQIETSAETTIETTLETALNTTPDTTLDTVSNATLETIKILQESQKNTKIWIGTLMGIVLILFFFTFGSLVDKAPPIFFTIETIITIIILPCFFMLNRISFGILKMKKGNKKEFSDILGKMHRDDVDKKPEEVLENLNS